MSACLFTLTFFSLREEFGELRRFVPPEMCKLPANDPTPSNLSFLGITTFQAHWDAGRNRYKDVPCQDKLRVILKWPNQQHDYIHAK